MHEIDTSRSHPTEVVNPYGPPAPQPLAPGWAAVGAPPVAAPPIVPPRGRIGTGGIVAIVAGPLVVLLFVGAMALGAGFFAGYGFGSTSFEDDYYGGDELPVAQGTVVDENGEEVPGVGTYTAPARMGEHGLSWPLAEGGTVTYVVDAVDWDAVAAVAAAAPDNAPPSEGSKYVLVTVHGSYVGPGHVDLEEQLYLDIETDEDLYMADPTLAIAPEPLWRQGGITDGETAAGQVLVEVPDDLDPGSAVLSLSTWDGDYLYVDAG